MNAKIQGKTLEEALDILFSDKPLKYEITGEHVIISKTTEKQQQQPQRMTEITGVVVWLSWSKEPPWEPPPTSMEILN